MLYNTQRRQAYVALSWLNSDKIMIICPFCQAEQVDNTIYCGECGHYLLGEDDKRRTEHYDRDEIHSNLDPPTQPRIILPLDLAGPIVVHLTVVSNQREIQLALDKRLLLGRIDPALNVFPDVDLTHDGPPAKSVSRRHATISRQSEKVVVEDLGSVNGTYLNSHRLDPYVPNTLNDGDMLQLGKLRIEVKIRKR